MEPASPGGLLLLYDGSSIADRALAEAIARAGAAGVSITLLGVIPPRLWRAKRGQFQVAPEKHDEEFAQEQLARARERCRAAGLHTESRVRTGSPAHVIAEEAARGYSTLVLPVRRSFAGAPSLARVVGVPDGCEVVAVE